MEDQLKHEWLASLEVGRKAFHAELTHISDALAARTPGEGGWSILECVEHVTVAESELLLRLRRAKPVPQTEPNPAREGIISQRAKDRKQRIEAPADSRPAGRFKTLLEALAGFDHARAETIRWLREFSGDLRGYFTDHPLIPGPVSCHEILLLIAAHPARHSIQVHEIRSRLESGLGPESHSGSTASG